METTGEVRAGRRWFAVCEDMFDHPVVGTHIPPPRPADQSKPAWFPFMAWQWLVKEAAWKPKTVLIAGKEITLERGELCHAQSFMANAWNWGRQAVREFLGRLSKCGMVKTGCDRIDFKSNHTNGHTPNIITICNYRRYQNGEQSSNQQDNPPATSQQPASNHKQYKDTKVQIEESPKGDLASVDAADPSKQIDPLIAFNEYNDLARKIGIPQAGKLTPERRKKIAARLREHGGLEAWREALVKLGQSNFLLGRNERGWTASLDFLVRPASFAKLLDGGYDNRAPFVADRNPETENDRRRRELLAAVTAPLATNGGVREH